MRVVCDQCAATYKVPNTKLTKPINKATCRQCGSRLLIPKPQPTADEDERVVVPAIPPTTGVADQGIVQPGEEDDADKTVPVVRRGEKPKPKTPDDIELLEGASLSAADQAKLERARSGGFSSSSEATVAVQRLRPERSSEPAAAPPPPPVYQQPAAAPPAQSGGNKFIVPALIVMFGLVAMGLFIFGGFYLYVNSAPPTTVATAPAPAPVEAPAAVEEPPAPAAEEEAEEAPAAEEEASTDDAVAEAPAAEEEAEEAPEPAPAPKTTRSEPAPAPAPKPRTTTTRSTASSGSTSAATTTRSAERPVIEPEPEPEPAPAPAPAPVREPASGSSAAPSEPAGDQLMSTVPPEVIHTIVSTNVAVKRCFYEALKSREIQKPITVRTTFNLSASGSASNLRVNNTELRGSRLERCLDSAFRGMSFPPSAKGGPVNYPFKLQ